MLKDNKTPKQIYLLRGDNYRCSTLIRGKATFIKVITPTLRLAGGVASSVIAKLCINYMHFYIIKSSKNNQKSGLPAYFEYFSMYSSYVPVKSMILFSSTISIMRFATVSMISWSCVANSITPL